ncbi:MAG: hypothetical protein ACLPVY_16795 [Acidimicrobiia bacterium]
MNSETPPQGLTSTSDPVSLVAAHLQAVRAAKPYANDVELASDILPRCALPPTAPSRVELTLRLTDEVRRRRHTIP